MNFLRNIAVCVSVVTLFTTKISFGQVEFQGSQYLFDKTYINPAFMGLNAKASVHIQHQSSGTGEVNGAKNYTTSAAGNYAITEKAAIGFNYVRSTFGNDNYSIGYGNYVYHLPLSEDLVMSSALGLGLQQYNINLSSLVTANAMDPLARQNIYSSKLDGRFGLVGTFKKEYYFGVSFDNILSLYTNKNSFAYELPPSFRRINMYMILGADKYIDEHLSVLPSIMYVKNMGGITSLDVNVSLLFERSFSFGVGFRQRVEEAKSFMIDDGSTTSQSLLRANMFYQIDKAKNRFKLGYCYNMNAGRGGVKVGSHDLALAYTIPKFK